MNYKNLRMLALAAAVTVVTLICVAYVSPTPLPCRQSLGN